jgi:hypothetical protein
MTKGTMAGALKISKEKNDYIPDKALPNGLDTQTNCATTRDDYLAPIIVIIALLSGLGNIQGC